MGVSILHACFLPQGALCHYKPNNPDMGGGSKLAESRFPYPGSIFDGMHNQDGASHLLISWLNDSIQHRL